jgi:hypothetical protein
LKVFTGLEVLLCVVKMLLSNLADLSNLAGQASLSSLLSQYIHCVINNVFHLMVLALDAEVNIKEAVKLEVESIVREMVLSSL